MAFSNQDLLSLEFDDDDCKELFITQESKEDGDSVKSVKFVANCDGNEFQFGVHNMDFSSPCVSLMGKHRGDTVPHYSDISDDENIFEENMDTSNSK